MLFKTSRHEVNSKHNFLKLTTFPFPKSANYINEEPACPELMAVTFTNGYVI